MKYCSHCGAEIEDEAIVCVKCGCSVTNTNRALENPNESTTAYTILGFFLPLIGLILFLLWQNEYPRRAKAAGKGALISVILTVVVAIIYGIVVGILVSSI